MSTFIMLTIITFVSLLITSHNVIAHKAAIYHPENPKLQHLTSWKSDESESKLRAAVDVIHMVYVISLEVGHQTVYLVFDTGSEFTWVEIASCAKCLPNQPPIIARYNGSTDMEYKSCEGNDDCLVYFQTPEGKCLKGLCVYHIGYVDGSDSYGNVVSDIFTPFANKSISTTMFFGVGTNNTCRPLYSCFQGIAGFGAGPLTLPSQLDPPATRWGFCLPPNATLDGAWMVGDEAQIVGDFKKAPLYDAQYYYLANLTAVFLYGTQVMNPQDSPSKILMDTGATLTRLVSPILNSLLYHVKDTINVGYAAIPIQSPYPNTFELCYEYPYAIEVTLQLGDVLIIVSNPTDLWSNLDNSVYCLTFVRHKTNGLSVIGNKHLRGHTIVYDLTDLDNPFVEVSLGQDGEGCLTPTGA